MFCGFEHSSIFKDYRKRIWDKKSAPAFTAGGIRIIRNQKQIFDTGVHGAYTEFAIWKNFDHLSNLSMTRQRTHQTLPMARHCALTKTSTASRRTCLAPQNPSDPFVVESFLVFFVTSNEYRMVLRRCSVPALTAQEKTLWRHLHLYQYLYQCSIRGSLATLLALVPSSLAGKLGWKSNMLIIGGLDHIDILLLLLLLCISNLW